MHLPPLISDLATILAVAAVVTFAFQKIRQPVVLGYLIAGVIVGPYTPTGLSVTDISGVKVWAEIGVIFLMFSLGLEFTFHKLIRVGIPAAGTAVVEVVLMVLLGFLAGRILGWTTIDSLFLGGILSISSTTIIIKAFDELGLRTRRFAEIVFGTLIVEDLVAILLLVALSTVAVTQSLFSMELVVAAAKLLLVVGSWFLVGYLVIPSFFKYAGKTMSNETLTVLSTGLCLILVVVATHFNYSAALGGFIMGSILAETSEAHRIESLIQPLKNLFAAVFFVSVGMLVDPSVLTANAGSIAFITLLTIFGKIFSTTLGALVTGQPLKRSVQIGFSLAQIGEFSFIIATLGSALKVTSDFLYPIAVTVSVVTTFTTPYLVRCSEGVADYLERALPRRLTRRLAGYSVWVQSARGEGATRRPGARSAIRFLLNAVLVTLVFLGMSEFGLNWLVRTVSDAGWITLVAWALSVLLSAPFIWGMFFAFRFPPILEQSPRGATISYGLYPFLGRLGTVIWLGILSLAFFPTGTSLLITFLAAGLLFIALYRNLERSYLWFENHLISNLQGKDPQDVNLSALAPWDLHLVRLVLHQNSRLAGREIKSEQIRTRFGLNIVAIQRGLEVIAAPRAEDILFPNDELLVLGGDEQMDRFRKEVEVPSKDKTSGPELSEYSLRQLRIEVDSEFIGKTIRDSGLRQRLSGLVVGLERASFRTINPDPDTVLLAGDVLWLMSGLPQQ